MASFVSSQQIVSAKEQVPQLVSAKEQVPQLVSENEHAIKSFEKFQEFVDEFLPQYVMQSEKPIQQLISEIQEIVKNLKYTNPFNQKPKEIPLEEIPFDKIYKLILLVYFAPTLCSLYNLMPIYFQNEKMLQFEQIINDALILTGGKYKIFGKDYGRDKIEIMPGGGQKGGVYMPLSAFGICVIIAFRCGDIFIRQLGNLDMDLKMAESNVKIVQKMTPHPDEAYFVTRTVKDYIVQGSSLGACLISAQTNTDMYGCAFDALEMVTKLNDGAKFVVNKAGYVDFIYPTADGNYTYSMRDVGVTANDPFIVYQQEVEDNKKIPEIGSFHRGQATINSETIAALAKLGGDKTHLTSLLGGLQGTPIGDALATFVRSGGTNIDALNIFIGGLNTFANVPVAMLLSYNNRFGVGIKASRDVVKHGTAATSSALGVMLGFVAIAGGLASLQSIAIQAGFKPSFRITQSEKGGGKTRNKRKTNKKKRKTIKRRKTNKRRKVSRK